VRVVVVAGGAGLLLCHFLHHHDSQDVDVDVSHVRDVQPFQKCLFSMIGLQVVGGAMVILFSL
jgi:hypothetical protein